MAGILEGNFTHPQQLVNMANFTKCLYKSFNFLAELNRRLPDCFGELLLTIDG